MPEVKRCADTNELISSFDRYLKSRHWKLKKQEFRESSFYNGRCYKCWKAKAGIKIIHKDKSQELGDEAMEELLAVCPSCFNRYHSGIGEIIKEAAEAKRGKEVVVKKPVITHKDKYKGKKRGDCLEGDVTF